MTKTAEVRSPASAPLLEKRCNRVLCKPRPAKCHGRFFRAIVETAATPVRCILKCRLERLVSDASMSRRFSIWKQSSMVHRTFLCPSSLISTWWLTPHTLASQESTLQEDQVCGLSGQVSCSALLHWKQSSLSGSNSSCFSNVIDLHSYSIV